MSSGKLLAFGSQLGIAQTMNDGVSPAYWWVNQGNTYDEARTKGFIWAPKESKSGGRLFHWENVSRVRAGDIIFHYAEGELRAISKAKANGYDAKKELGGNQWSDDGWRVDSDYIDLANPVPIDELMDLIARFESDRRNKPVGNLRRLSPHPRVLPLRDVLKARV